ncbi:hypothetical protein GUI12_01185 [Anaplasmataceae bacterium AB001_6]|nr:hypothetical protein GUI12_01185 [Anaplasmataceae bacterium AB001_6]
MFNYVYIAEISSLMIVTCKSCKTKYYVKQSSLAKNKKFRCTYCDHIWNQDFFLDEEDENNDKERGFSLKKATLWMLLFVLLSCMTLVMLVLYGEKFDINLKPYFYFTDLSGVHVENTHSSLYSEDDLRYMRVKSDICNANGYDIRNFWIVLEVFDSDSNLLIKYRFRINNEAIKSESCFKFEKILKVDFSDHGQFTVLKIVNFWELFFT